MCNNQRTMCAAQRERCLFVVCLSPGAMPASLEASREICCHEPHGGRAISNSSLAASNKSMMMDKYSLMRPREGKSEMLAPEGTKLNHTLAWAAALNM